MASCSQALFRVLPPWSGSGHPAQSFWSLNGEGRRPPFVCGRLRECLDSKCSLLVLPFTALPRGRTLGDSMVSTTRSKSGVAAITKVIQFLALVKVLSFKEGL